MLISLISVSYLMYSSKKYYNWTLPCIGVFFLGIFFKVNHWPGAGALITVSSALVMINLYFFSIKSFSTFKRKPFLKWFCFFTAIALMLFMYAFMSKIQHWPLIIPFWLLKHIINFLLIILTLVLIFKLPGLNFATWPHLDRVVFYRQILLPLVIIFLFNITIFVSPNFLDAIFNRGWELHPWRMDDIELQNLEGLKSVLFLFL